MIPHNLTTKSKLNSVLSSIDLAKHMLQINELRYTEQEKDILMPKMCDLIGASNIPLYTLT